MATRRLIQEQIAVVAGHFNDHADRIEEFLSNPIQFSHVGDAASRFTQSAAAELAHAHGYLEGCADVMDLTVLEMLEELGIDLHASESFPDQRRRAERKRPRPVPRSLPKPR
jgi:hypothetical protein